MKVPSITLVLTFLSFLLRSQGSMQTDSLNGFAEQSLRTQYNYLSRSELELFVTKLKREFIAVKFFHAPTSQIALNQKLSNSVINSVPCNNENFEANGPGAYSSVSSVTGWSLTNRILTGTCTVSYGWQGGSSNFSLVSTPVLSINSIGTLPVSPLGGTVVAKLNSLPSSPGYRATRLSQTFPVSASNQYFNYAVAAVMMDGGSGHGCCNNSGYQVNFYDCSNNLITCGTNFSISACPAEASVHCNFDGLQWYHGWQLHSVDLFNYINSCVTVEIIANDCNYGAHNCMLFFDAECGSVAVPNAVNSPAISFCPTSTLALIQAAFGSSTYSWSAPAAYSLSAAQSTMSLLSISNPSAGSIFTLNTTENSSCTITQTVMLNTTQVAAVLTQTLLSCMPGSTGSATVFPSGSSSGYNFIWSNSNSNVVSTSSIANNLLPGLYTVSVSALPGCGSASTTVTISSYPTSVFSLTAPPSTSLCAGNSMTVITTQGSSLGYFVWSPSSFLSSVFSSSSIVTPSAPAGTSVSLTYSVLLVPSYSPCAFQQTFEVNYFNPPSPTLATIPALCVNSSSIQTVGGPSGGWYSSDAVVDSLSGILNPFLSTPGGKVLQYSVQLGPCVNSASIQFTINALPPVSTANTVNICQGKTTTLTINGNYIKSWNGQTTASIAVSPTVNTVYLASCTNAATSCSNAAQVTVNVLPNPTINVAGSSTVCENQQFTLTASGADTYTWNGFPNQVLITTAPLGLSTFTVGGTYISTNCKAVRTYTMLTLGFPTLSVLGKATACEGEALNFSAIGATTYSWNGILGNNNYTLSASPNMSLLLTGVSPGTCIDSLNISVQVSKCNGLDENLEASERIFPNPLSSEFFIESQAPGIVELYDLDGRLLLKAPYASGLTNITLANFAGGVYLLKINTGNRVTVKKILIVP